MKNPGKTILKEMHQTLLELLGTANEKKIMALLAKPLLDNNDVMVIFQKSDRSMRRWREMGTIRYCLIAGRAYYQWDDVLDTLNMRGRN